jgi:hypothetical protein
MPQARSVIAVPLTRANGATHPQPPPSVPLVPQWPAGPWPRRPVFLPPPPGARLLKLVALPRQDLVPAAAPATRVPWRPRIPAVDGDTVITWAMTLNVAVVAVDAAIVSYSHIYDLATGAPGSGTETGIQPHLLPLSIDGVIAEASLVMLYAARHKLSTPKLAWIMLLLGIVATVAANVAHGLPSTLISSTTHDVISALLSAWPAGAFIGSVEMAMQLVRATRDVASAGGGTLGDDGTGTVVAPPATSRRQRRRTARDVPPRSPRRKPATRPAAPPGTAGTADPVVAAIKDHDAWKAGRKLTRDDKDAIAQTAGVTRRSVERCLIDARRMGTVKG